MRYGIGLVLSVGLLVSGAAVAQPAADYTAREAADALLNLKCAKGTVLGPDGICDAVVTNGKGLHLTAELPKSHGPAQTPAPRSAAAGRTSTAAPGETRMASLSQPATAMAKPRVSASDLLITFRLGSAELTDKGMANARNFAAGLNDPRLGNLAVEIAGHTDATGAVERNDVLSQERADAVKQFLVGLGVDGSRLRAKGYGARQLANPNAPAAPANRRVEVKLAG